MSTSGFHAVSDLPLPAVDLLANMPLPHGCGAMLFDSFRVLLFVVLSVGLAVMLSVGLAVMLWHSFRRRRANIELVHGLRRT